MQRLTKFTMILALVLTSCTSQEKTGKPQSDLSEPSAATQETPSEALPDAAELLDAHTKAAGGADKIPSFESIHAKGTLDTGSQKLSGTVEMWWKKGGNFYVEQFVEGIGLSRCGYDGTTIWVDDPIYHLRILEGEEAVSFIQTSLMFPTNDWREHFSEAKTIGKQPIDGGGEAWEVELVSKGGPNMTFGLDVDTKLIRYMKTTQVMPTGKLPIEAYAEDYQDFGGYKFAMKKRSEVKRLLELEEIITTFEINVPIDDSIFVYPSKREQVPVDPTAQPAVVVPAAPASPPAGPPPAGK